MLSDGSIHGCNSQGFPTYDQSGKVIELFGTTQGITGKRNLIQCNRDNLPAGQIYQLKVEPGGSSGFTYVSAAVEQLHECTVEQVISDPSLLFSRLVEEDRASLANATEKSIKELSVFDCVVRIRRKSGAIRYHRMISRPRRMDAGSILFDGIDMDITESRLAEELIKNEKDRAKRYLDLADVMFIGLDLNGNINLSNKMSRIFFRIVEYKPKKC